MEGVLPQLVAVGDGVEGAHVQGLGANDWLGGSAAYIKNMYGSLAPGRVGDLGDNEGDGIAFPIARPHKEEADGVEAVAICAERAKVVDGAGGINACLLAHFLAHRFSKRNARVPKMVLAKEATPPVAVVPIHIHITFFDGIAETSFHAHAPYVGGIALVDVVKRVESCCATECRVQWS